MKGKDAFASAPASSQAGETIYRVLSSILARFLQPDFSSRPRGAQSPALSPPQTRPQREDTWSQLLGKICIVLTWSHQAPTLKHHSTTNVCSYRPQKIQTCTSIQNLLSHKAFIFLFGLNSNVFALHFASSGCIMCHSSPLTDRRYCCTLLPEPLAYWKRASARLLSIQIKFLQMSEFMFVSGHTESKL